MTLKNEFLWQFLICISSKYFDRKSRATRKEFWGFTIYSVGISLLVNNLLLGYENTLQDISPSFTHFSIAVNFIIFLFLFIPRINTGIRRFHDTDRSGLIPIIFMFIYSVPILLSYLSYLQIALDRPYNSFNPSMQLGLAYSIFQFLLFIFYVYVAFERGTEGANKYGSDPLELNTIEDDLEQIGLS